MQFLSWGAGRWGGEHSVSPGTRTALVFSEAEELRPWLSFVVKMVLADSEGLIVTDRP